jgi:hypothetical protein
VIPHHQYWKLWCRALVRIAEERREYLRLEMDEGSDSENLNGQYMGVDLLVQRLVSVLGDAETAERVYLCAPTISGLETAVEGAVAGQAEWDES